MNKKPHLPDLPGARGKWFIVQQHLVDSLSPEQVIIALTCPTLA